VHIAEVGTKLDARSHVHVFSHLQAQRRGRFEVARLLTLPFIDGGLIQTT
jgi:hypothetical protein